IKDLACLRQKNIGQAEQKMAWTTSASSKAVEASLKSNPQIRVIGEHISELEVDRANPSV
ncbi:hypothetical protein BG015_004481, partial [Linnemannia schmuckeri]